MQVITLIRCLYFPQQQKACSKSLSYKGLFPRLDRFDIFLELTFPHCILFSKKHHPSQTTKSQTFLPGDERDMTYRSLRHRGYRLFCEP